MTPKEKKYLKIAAGVAAAALVIKLLLPKTDNGGSLTDPTQNGGTATAPGYVFNAQQVADKLYNAMKNSGTDEEAIIRALNPVSVQQFSQVLSKFGKKSYNKTMGNQINYFPITPLPLEPLPVWLKSELSTERYNFLALKYPQL